MSDVVILVADALTAVAWAAVAAGATPASVAEAVEGAAAALALVAKPRGARPQMQFFIGGEASEKGGKDEKEFGPVILASGGFGADFTQISLL